MSRKIMKKMTQEEYLQKEKELIGSSTVVFDGPVLTGGKNVIAHSLGGKEFLDFTGQISLLNTGYAPIEVVSVLKRMAGKLHACLSADWPYCVPINIGRKKLEISRVALAERLIKITEKVMPFKKRVYFEVSGATAVSLAAKIAKITYLRKREEQTKDIAGKTFERVQLEVRLKSLFEKDIFIPFQNDLCKFSFLVFRNAFHGRHGEAQLFTNSKPKQLWAVSSSCAVGRLPFPGAYATGISEKTDKIIEALSKFAPVIAFIFEPIQGEGGINVPDSFTFNLLITRLRERGIYIIADEIQTGFGRTGKMWACEHFGIEPDMLVTSKSLGAGIPLGAVIVNAEKFPDLDLGMHSGSMHASPMAVAAAIANIDKILNENLVDRSCCYGEYVIRRLKEIAKRYITDIIDVRGLGLMIGIEFTYVDTRDMILARCMDNGLLLAKAGEKTIRMTPPLIVTIPEIDQALEIFANAVHTQRDFRYKCRFG